MATDGIRLPRDNTVASQRLTRDSGLPETQPRPSNNGSAAPQPSPLLTVVLQANPIIEGRKDALYELVLQNDPKDQPPIKLQANTYIQPGTSLLLEKDQSGQYQPVDQPSREQLAKLILLELDYQRAHLLPKMDASADANLFKLATSPSLLRQYPELKPLLTWLNQGSYSLNALTLFSTFQQFTPLANLRPWADLLSALPQANQTPQATTNSATNAINNGATNTLASGANIAASGLPNPTVASNSVDALQAKLASLLSTLGQGVLTKAAANVLPISTSGLSTSAPHSGPVSTASSSHSILANLVADPRFPTKIGLTAPVLPPEQIPSGSKTELPISALQNFATKLGLIPTSHNLGLNPIANINSQVTATTGIVDTSRASQSANASGQPAAGAQSQLSAPASQTSAALPLPNGLQQLFASRPSLLADINTLVGRQSPANITVETGLNNVKFSQIQTATGEPKAANNVSGQSAVNSNTNSALSQAPAQKAQATGLQSAVKEPTLPTKQQLTNPPQTPTGLSSTPNTRSELAVNFSTSAASNSAASNISASTIGATNESQQRATQPLVTLQPPEVSSREPHRSLVPLEITLGQWIEKIDALIAQSPSHLQKQLTTQAQQLIQQMAQTPSQIVNQTTEQQSSTSKDEPLLALRSWLEATQSRIQHSAIQTATQHWAAPDQPPVQQMQLPLIWLGLTAWADVEWWQEQDKENEKKESTKKAMRRWRMKIYLTLAPMAPMCADIEWSSEFTQLTFWSEDASTLGHLNNLLPTLENWTMGLGERALTTKHGMPQRINKETEKPNQHLVDIRT